MLLWTFVYKFLHRHMFSLLLGIYLGMELLDHMVWSNKSSLSLIIWWTARLFSKVAASFYIPTSNAWDNCDLLGLPSYCTHCRINVGLNQYVCNCINANGGVTWVLYLLGRNKGIWVLIPTILQCYAEIINILWQAAFPWSLPQP